VEGGCACKWAKDEAMEDCKFFAAPHAFVIGAGIAGYSFKKSVEAFLRGCFSKKLCTNQALKQLIVIALYCGANSSVPVRIFVRAIG
jgi:hypothetical protein